MLQIISTTPIRSFEVSHYDEMTQEEAQRRVSKDAENWKERFPDGGCWGNFFPNGIMGKIILVTPGK